MDENKHNNLISLLKLFKNRPYHLSKYLLDNDAFTEDFLNKIKVSDRLSNISDTKYFFKDINQMEEFFDSLIESNNYNNSNNYNYSDLETSLNNKLKKLITEEKYEEAAVLRDFMINKNIKKK
jgi:dsDNA-specific endonuclease/ATPase MutS2